MIDLSHLPVVDVRSHPFLNPGAMTVERFVDAFSFSGGGVPFLVEGGLPHDQALIDEVQRVLAAGSVAGILEFKKVEPPPGPPLPVRLTPSQVDDMICSRGFTKLGYVEAGDCMYLSTYKKVS